MPTITVKKTLTNPFVSAGLGFGELAFKNDTKELAIGLNGGGYAVIGNASVTTSHATLDGNGKIPMSQMPDAVAAGQLSYKGLINLPSVGYPSTSSAVTGDYFVNTTSGSYDNKSWTVGDLIIFNGVIWQQVQGGQSDVVSVAGRTGTIILDVTDITNAATTASPLFSGTISGEDVILTGSISATTFNGEIDCGFY
jgi:hypothetical protein